MPVIRAFIVRVDRRSAAPAAVAQLDEHRVPETCAYPSRTEYTARTVMLAEDARDGAFLTRAVPHARLITFSGCLLGAADVQIQIVRDLVVHRLLGRIQAILGAGPPLQAIEMASGAALRARRAPRATGNR